MGYYRKIVLILQKIKRAIKYQDSPYEENHHTNIIIYYARNNIICSKATKS